MLFPMVGFGALLSCSHFIPSPQEIVSISRSSNTIYLCAISGFPDVLPSTFQEHFNWNVQVCSPFTLHHPHTWPSLDPAVHAIGSELTFSSPLFSHQIIYQILSLILDFSVLSTVLLPHWHYLFQATKSFLTCFYVFCFVRSYSLLFN